ncbi:MAG: ABC transporter permease, partial [Candidatus Dormibacteria bacterium]
MTATTATTAPHTDPSLTQLARWAVSDSLVMTRRNLLVWLRVPAYIVFTVVQPVIFVLLFRYVFGGAIRVANSGGYVDFLMPGIIGQTAAFATFATAIALAQEAKAGVIDRLRSLPMARSAVLAGRLLADGIRMLVTILVIIAVGYAVGFRFQNGLPSAIAMILLAELFGVSICCVSAFIREGASAQTFDYLGRTIVVPPEVQPITGMSHLLGEAVLAEVRAGDRVLDMGTGSGVNAILAASTATSVLAVDISPH